MGLRWLVQDANNAEGFIGLYMPIWSLEELVACRDALHPGMSDVALCSRFDRRGGIPRSVLEKLDDFSHALLEQAIASATLPIIAKCVGRISALPEVSLLIFHLHVGADLLEATVQWASTWGAEEVAVRLFQLETDNLIRFLKHAANSCKVIVNTAGVDSNLGGVRRTLWEGLCHRCWLLVASLNISPWAQQTSSSKGLPNS